MTFSTIPTSVIRYLIALPGSKKTSIVICFIVAIVIISTCVQVGPTNEAAAISISICFLGGVLGWIAGMSISPFDKVEHVRFAAIGKTVSVFFTGYLVSKLDKAVDVAATKLTNLIANIGDRVYILQHVPTARIVGFITFFFIGLIAVYVDRAYQANVHPKRVARRQRRRPIRRAPRNTPPQANVAS